MDTINKLAQEITLSYSFWKWSLVTCFGKDMEPWDGRFFLFRYLTTTPHCLTKWEKYRWDNISTKEKYVICKYLVFSDMAEFEHMAIDESLTLYDWG